MHSFESTNNNNCNSMKANYLWRTTQGAQLLAELLADTMVEQINHCIAEDDLAVIALSGGSTPKPLFKALANRQVDWAKVIVTLVDERWVDESHELSNAAFLKEWFVSPLSIKPTFVSLYQTGELNAQAIEQVLSNYCEVTGSSVAEPRAFDIVILGMGGDGHTASFFPDAENINSLVNVNNPDYLLTCESPSTQVPRITWSLPMLLNTRFLALHFTGADKKGVFDQAQQSGLISDLPIRSALFQQQTPLQVYYSD